MFHTVSLDYMVCVGSLPCLKYPKQLSVHKRTDFITTRRFLAAPELFKTSCFIDGYIVSSDCVSDCVYRFLATLEILCKLRRINRIHLLYWFLGAPVYRPSSLLWCTWVTKVGYTECIRVYSNNKSNTYK